MRRLYLDNAATSFPKPPGVYEAMMDYGTRLGASPGRGHYAESREGARLIRECRERLNTLINGESANHIIFALNTSDALNLAIKGVVRHRVREHPGRPVHLLTTAMDHNSVLRPFNALAEHGAEWRYLACDPETALVNPAAVAAAITPDTALVAVNMASNVTGTLQPVAEIGRICRERGVLYLIDAAQALGHVPVDVRALSCDLLAFPGHKGLMGPQGTGGLYIRPGVEHLVATTREGGTGSLSEHDVQPSSLPEKYEAGSHNTIGIVGLSRAVEWILDRGVSSLREHELGLIELMTDLLHAGGARVQGREPLDGPLSALRLVGPGDPPARVGVFSLTHDTMPPAEMAVMLEQLGVLVRSGIHCAPHAHATVGTLDSHGAFRLSFGPFVTEDDVRFACGALAEVCAEVSAAAPPVRA
ncbi:MAG TPA: aminotransferase class V-fold PLP-dependent enzyme [Phycisphaerales bacterium]|nr:aminotransferase class V-fold PLP-dependent enzyme [Phycisphaerales bacterium]